MEPQIGGQTGHEPLAVAGPIPVLQLLPGNALPDLPVRLHPQIVYGLVRSGARGFEYRAHVAEQYLITLQGRYLAQRRLLVYG